ncbi:hypothetical protein BDY24DRAFT_278794 [Mrakia frigida]|uniref:uncharacterized protein n=1 Tax=Mrakia frigida TaxID=29902 RepID=UPI003FCC0871
MPSLSSRTFLLFLLALPLTQAFFILNHAPLVRTRLDPIVSPGAVAQHEHNIVGGSKFGKDYSQADSLTGRCTTAEVTLDKSNYWAPQLYYYEPIKKTYQAIPSYTKTYYLQRPGSKNEKIHAFPDGLKMIAGNPYRRTYDSSSFADQAVSFVCLDYYNSHTGDPEWEQTSAGFFKHNCPDGLRTQVFFPACWDGVNLDSPNHSSHMAYPLDNPQGGNCPSTHPVHLVSLFYEFVWSVGDFPFNAVGTPTWVLANGDTTGLGFHGDFTNGWPTGDNNILQQAIDTCGDETGGVVDECAVFVPYIDREAAAACQPEGAIVDEAIGWGSPISALPGDNPIWIGNGSKPTTAGYSANPGYTVTSSALPSGWSNLGCIAEGTSGRAMNGGYKSDSANMTLGVCATYCEGLGLPYAGVEYGQECYCTSVMRNGASTTLINSNLCDDKCSGLVTENCGGSSTLTLLYNPDNVAAPASLPSGWAAPSTGSCRTEPSGVRALAGASTASDALTIESCVNYCVGKGYSIAGMEYGRECYCANTITSSSLVAADTDCNMPCAGNLGQTCGGSSRLSIYQKSAVTTTTSTSSKASSALASASASSSAVTLSNGWTSNGACTSDTTRLMTTSYVLSTMTYEICTDYCSGQGFSQAGLEYGTQCWCSSSVDLTKTSTSTACTMACGGNSAVKCGGAYAMQIFVAPASTSTTSTKATVTSTTTAATASASSISLSNGWTSTGGCINDPTSARLMTKTIDQSGMTYEICTNYCSGLGYSQAGLEYGTQCWCSSSLDVSSTTSSTACTSACGGNSALKCGGFYAMTLFSAPAVVVSSSSSTKAVVPSTSTTSTKAATATATSSAIVLSNGWTSTGGCASDSPRLMTVSYGSTSMTHELCTNYCSGLGYTQAGVQYSSQCYCSSSVDMTALKTSTACTNTCSGNSAQICGGAYAMNIFTNPNAASPTTSSSTIKATSTSSSSSSTKFVTSTSSSASAVASSSVVAPSGWSYSSCVSDSASPRALSGYFVDSSTMTLQICATTCSSKGYSMFGVEYYTQCLCGNALATTSSTLAESSCSYACGGSSTEKCGGFSAMSLFVIKPTSRKRGASVWSSSRV